MPSSSPNDPRPTRPNRRSSNGRSPAHPRALSLSAGEPSRLRRLFADTRPFQSPHYTRLFTANIITVIGAQLTVITVPAQLWAITRDSSIVGLTGIVGLVPLVIFGLWGGAIADAFDRRRVLEVTTLGLIITGFMFFAQAALGLDNVPLILAIFALQQAFFAVNQPTRTALLPSIMPAAHLASANALNMTLFSFGAVAGPLLGGALLPLLGFAPLYLIDAVFLFATLYAVYRLPSLKPVGVTRAPGLRSVLDGLKVAWVNKVLLASFVVDLIAMVFGMPRALYPQLADENFGGPSTGGIEFALLSAAIAIGALLGGLLSGWTGRVTWLGKATLNSIAVWGVAIALAGGAAILAPRYGTLMLIAAVAALALAGAADMASAAMRQTILQTAATDEMRGRLQGVFIVIVAGGPRVADALHGLAAEWFGAGLTTLLGGMLVVVGILVSAVALPGFRRYRLGAA